VLDFAAQRRRDAKIRKGIPWEIVVTVECQISNKEFREAKFSTVILPGEFLVKNSTFTFFATPLRLRAEDFLNQV